MNGSVAVDDGDPWDEQLARRMRERMWASFSNDELTALRDRIVNAARREDLNADLLLRATKVMLEPLGHGALSAPEYEHLLAVVTGLAIATGVARAVRCVPGIDALSKVQRDFELDNIVKMQIADVLDGEVVP